jgi:hypothetical protein
MGDLRFTSGLGMAASRWRSVTTRQAATELRLPLTSPFSTLVLSERCSYDPSVINGVPPMQCNIDAKGKAVRLIMGGLMVIAAAVIAVIVAMDVLAPHWGWAAAGMGVFGAFGMFEGWKGWCVVRAMGFKTRL